jgi:hypothetical protein
MRKLLKIAAAISTVFALGAAQAASFVLVDDFNGPDMLVFDTTTASGGGVTVGPVGPVNTGGAIPLSRTVTHELLAGPNGPTGSSSNVEIGSTAFPTGSLNVNNATGRDSQVTIAWTLPSNFITDPGATSFLFNVILSDANTTTAQLFIGATSLGSFLIPGNSANLPLAFAITAANKGLINAGGILKMVLDGEDGWDMAMDSFGFQIPEPTSLALVGLALLGAGVVTRRRKA